MISLEILKERSLKNMGPVIREVRENALRMIELAYEEGIQVQISSGYRSLEDQARLYGQGRPGYIWRGRRYGSKGKIVTYALPGQSTHNDRRAVDFFILSNDGKAHWTVDDRWKRAGAIAKSLGFSWGGDWEKFLDYPHLEWPKRISAGYVLKRGAQGAQVKEFQNHLQSLGYDLLVDGRFGPITEQSVQQFQKKHGLKVDGVVGPMTWRKLKMMAYPGTPLKRGAVGREVIKVQRRIGVNADGLFGIRTEAAVKKYQRHFQIEVDGIVGPITWRYLFG
ncbi:peptidoglycan-binding protein [Halobacillus yeomjeoni]|uniref:peptidoglycan-binding protein n=1 Tax=Halobacillus yeomjeoni TaxID=311194 RepID=UPI001CD70438|nr:peptidoglycan-binding protein [Halobacillus yeomjeoni]MCA0985245.1 peptidoglycan-binding protein [Halobacillus yeomjeoni]